MIDITKTRECKRIFQLTGEDVWVRFVAGDVKYQAKFWRMSKISATLSFLEAGDIYKLKAPEQINWQDIESIERAY